MNEECYKVYIRINDKNDIIAVDSSAFIEDFDGWIEIDCGAGDKFHHAQGNYFEKPLCNAQRVCLYKYENGMAVPKSDEEVSSETQDAIQYEQGEITINDIAEMLVEQEMRITQLEEAKENDVI